MGSEVVVGLFTLGGVGAGFVGNYLIELRREGQAKKAEKVDLMAAARHVWSEVSKFNAAIEAAVAVPELAAEEGATVRWLRAHEQLDRYSDVIARQETIDFGALQRAYSVAWFAAGALAAGESPQGIKDTFRADIDEALRVLRPAAKLRTHTGGVEGDHAAAADGSGRGA